MLKALIRIRSKDIEDQFKKLDRGSYGELTPDLMFQLFKRFVFSSSFKFDFIEILVYRSNHR